jgi:hypothetical protein
VLLLVFINSRDLSQIREPDAVPTKVLQLRFEDRPDGSIAVVIFNPTDENKTIEIGLKTYKKNISINAKSLQTVVIKP